MTSVRQALDSAMAQLMVAGCDSARLDAELLVAWAMDEDRGVVYRDPDRALTEAELERVTYGATRRAARAPMAYITGRRWFRRLELCVDERVLIPRPESEHLVEAAIAELPEGARVADIGTGSGALALALRDERPDLVIVATDVSEGAVEVAAANAERLGLEVEFAVGDLLEPVDGPLDGVVANPPYVAEEARDTLMPEVRDHEPEVALFAAEHGLAVHRRLWDQCAQRRVPWVGVEVGWGQAPGVAALAVEAGYGELSVRRDLFGVARVLLARRLTT